MLNVFLFLVRTHPKSYSGSMMVGLLIKYLLFNAVPKREKVAVQG